MSMSVRSGTKNED